jgi:hypothetical protein
MLNAIENLLRLHPGSRFGLLEHHQSDFAAFEELESRHLRRRHEDEAERGDPTWMIGEVAAAVAMFVVFIGVLTVIARLTVDAPETGQQPVVAVFDAVELR